MARDALKGSEKSLLAQTRVLGPADPNERLEVTLILRPSAPQALQETMRPLLHGQRPGHLSRQEYAQRHGSSESDLQAVEAFAHPHGLAVVQRNAARHTVVLAGTVAQMEGAFGVKLLRCEYPGGTYRGREGAVALPEALHDIVAAVLGLDDRPQARPHFRIKAGRARRKSRAATPLVSSFTAAQLAALYEFPAGSGQGESIALIELGGGYRPQDLQQYFKSLGLTVPNVIAVSVDRAANRPTGDPSGPDGEVVLDIEVAGAIAPAATLVVYFAPNTDAGFLDAITTAVHDTARNPSVVSISWGGPEPDWTQQAMTAMDQAFQTAIALGITVCVASGDNGSTDGLADGANHVDFPASSPHVLSCGGTSLKATQTAITGEVVWNDRPPANGATGGGVSAFFALPSWQQGLTSTDAQGARSPLTNRGVPDVAGDADPQTGYQVLVDGKSTVYGGTSAVAPLWAGLLARINASSGHSAGFVNPLLYSGKRAFRDIVKGNNGGYRAARGWDACTGLGSPNGARIAAIRGL